MLVISPRRNKISTIKASTFAATESRLNSIRFVYWQRQSSRKVQFLGEGGSLMIIVNAWEKNNNENRVFEGGLARNSAYIRWLRENDADLHEIVQKRSRVWFIISILLTMLKSKFETILFLYPTVGVPIFNESILGTIAKSIFISFVQISKKRNRILFDISDLKYEQGTDLDINHDIIDAIRHFEEEFFAITSVWFIFASSSMRDYAVCKYHIDISNTIILINGGINNCYKESRYDHLLNPERINCVYAGTLNRGRNIDKMIARFPTGDKYRLFLIGTEGDWIKQEGNIVNLGALEETDAHCFVSKCDIGLIPYDARKPYYNVAYPTKLSFYITAGIPFISTPVNEAKRINENYGVGYISDFESWPETFSSITRESTTMQKRKIEGVCHEFSWDFLFSSCTILNNSITLIEK